jgi:hypothetical protein
MRGDSYGNQCHGHRLGVWTWKQHNFCKDLDELILGIPLRKRYQWRKLQFNGHMEPIKIV